MDFPFRRLAPLKNRASDGKPGPLRWRVPDLIDFDYYVAEDEQRIHDHPAERKRLAERDRRLYKDEIAPTIGDAGAHTTTHRSRALRWWLELRRRQEDPALAELLPGTAFERGQRLVTYTLGIIGFLLGIGVASTLLHYEGDHPVNVSWYLFWLVLVQILLAGTTLSLWYGRRTRVVRGAVQDVSLIGHLIRPVFARVARWMQQQRIAHVSPDLRERAEARKGLVQSNFALYGPAAYLPMLIPAQVFGIGFNIGAILITIALEWFTDLAFGWGSALNVSAGTIHGITHLIALPWSWLFGEGVGLPTLEQVAGTRISLKDPLYVLDAEHLRSWRWFLVLAVLTYGLLPRVILLGLSAHKQRRALAALPFTHQSAQAPYARMITPSLEVRITGTGPGPEMPIPSPLKPLTRPTAAPRPEPAVAPAGPEPAAKTPPPATTETGTRAAEPASATEGAREPRPAEAKQSSAERPSPAPARERKVAPAAQARTGPAPKAAAAPEPATKTEPAQTRDRAPPSAAPEPAPAPEPPQAPEQPAPPSPGAADATTEHVTVEADACILLLHIDVADLLEERDHARLQQLLRIQSGWRVAAAATYGGGRAMSEQALELVEAATWHAPPPRVALIQDGSQPPITENLRFLRALRAVTGEQAQVLLALTGDPDDSEDDPLPPLSEFDFIDWQRKIEQMGDPYLRLVTLTSADEAEDEGEDQ